MKIGVTNVFLILFPLSYDWLLLVFVFFFFFFLHPYRSLFLCLDELRLLAGIKGQDDFE